MNHECKSPQLFEAVEELERKGIEKRTLEELANREGFSASHFGNEYNIAKISYSLLSPLMGIVVAGLTDGVLKKLGVEADIPRWILSGGVGFGSAALIYTKAYLQRTLCKQNSQFYDFLKEKYKAVLDK